MVVSIKKCKKDGTQNKHGGEALVLKREVGVISGVSLILGAMIGSGIFVSPKGVFQNAGSVGVGLLIWLGCGVLAGSGALCYAEVGTMIPKSGGEFPILLEAFGPIPAFLFVWTASVVLRPSGIAILCLTFAQYFLAFLADGDCNEISEWAKKMVAIVLILTVVLINVFSVKLSTQFVTFFSAGKTLSLVIIVVGGLVHIFQGHTESFQDAFVPIGEPPGATDIVKAFYQGLWAFDGWNQLNYVVEELQDPYVNLPRCLVIALTLTTGLYMLTNVSYLSVMSLPELLASPAVGATFGATVLSFATWIIPFSVTMSVFGTALGACFASGRISYSAAKEGLFSRVLGMLHIQRRTPAPSVLFTGILVVVMLIPNDFDTLINYFAFCMWIFHGSTCAALLYLRYKLPDHPRPIRVPIVVPIFVVICATCLVLIPIIDDPKIEYLYSAMFVFSGLLIYFPFVKHGVCRTKIHAVNTFLQRLLLVAFAEEEAGA